MKTITLEQLVGIIGGNIKSGRTTISVSDVNFGQSRSIHNKQVYFYTNEIKWEKQLAAIHRGKPLAVVLPRHISSSSIPSSISVIQVADTYASFWKLARWNWKQHSNIKVLGVTGSAGKSTTTEMVASILKYRSSIVKTEGNLNTFMFLPFYLTRLKAHHTLLLLEMGMKSLNNIKKQCQIVQPQIGAVTNVGEAHSGSLGGINLVPKAKQELIDGLRTGGILYLNADDIRSKKLDPTRCKGKVKTFGIKNNSDVRGKNIRYKKTGMTFDIILENKVHSLFIPVFGTHNVYNALAAIGICRSFGATINEIKNGLSSFRAPQMRLQLISSRSGRVLINDAWNASPSSMQAGLDVLKNISSNRPTIAVLGDMLELGELSYSSHQKIGKQVAELKIDQLITIGSSAKWIAEAALKNGMAKTKVSSYHSLDSVLKHLSRLPKNGIFYFKASRKWRLEHLVQKMKQQ